MIHVRGIYEPPADYDFSEALERDEWQAPHGAGIVLAATAFLLVAGGFVCGLMASHWLGW